MKTHLAPIALLALFTAAVAIAATKPAPPPPAPPLPKTTIGVVLPSAQLGQGNTGTDVAEPVRATLISYLNGPKTTLVPISARLPAQIDAEAQEGGVDYIVYVTVKTRKHGGLGGFGKLLSAAGPLASMLPGLGGSAGSMTGMAAAQVASQVATQAAQSAAMEAQEQAMQQMAGATQNSVKKGDQITLEYRVMRPGDPTAVLSKSVDRKAGENGEDVLSPLLEGAASEMLAAISAPATTRTAAAIQ
jgi:hypothetical protein